MLLVNDVALASQLEEVLLTNSEQGATDTYWARVVQWFAAAVQRHDVDERARTVIMSALKHSKLCVVETGLKLIAALYDAGHVLGGECEALVLTVARAALLRGTGHEDAATNARSEMQEGKRMKMRKDETFDACVGLRIAALAVLKWCVSIVAEDETWISLVGRSLFDNNYYLRCDAAAVMNAIALAGGNTRPILMNWMIDSLRKGNRVDDDGDDVKRIQVVHEISRYSWGRVAIQKSSILMIILDSLQVNVDIFSRCERSASERCLLSAVEAGVLDNELGTMTKLARVTRLVLDDRIWASSKCLMSALGKSIHRNAAFVDGINRCFIDEQAEYPFYDDVRWCLWTIMNSRDYPIDLIVAWMEWITPSLRDRIVTQRLIPALDVSDRFCIAALRASAACAPSSSLISAVWTVWRITSCPNAKSLCTRRLCEWAGQMDFGGIVYQDIAAILDSNDDDAFADVCSILRYMGAAGARSECLAPAVLKRLHMCHELEEQCCIDLIEFVSTIFKIQRHSARATDVVLGLMSTANPAIQACVLGTILEWLTTNSIRDSLLACMHQAVPELQLKFSTIISQSECESVALAISILISIENENLFSDLGASKLLESTHDRLDSRPIRRAWSAASLRLLSQHNVETADLQCPPASAKSPDIPLPSIHNCNGDLECY